MKLGLKALVIALVMVLTAVPAAFAKNGGQGGHGKPSWGRAGQAVVGGLRARIRESSPREEGEEAQASRGPTRRRTRSPETTWTSRG
jgi:hypothetical protein